MENHFDENLSALPKVQEFPTSVGCFHEIIATNCLNTWAQIALTKINVIRIEHKDFKRKYCAHGDRPGTWKS